MNKLDAITTADLADGSALKLWAINNSVYSVRYYKLDRKPGFWWCEHCAYTGSLKSIVEYPNLVALKASIRKWLLTQ